MKNVVVVLLCLAPLAVSAAPTYTNEDLDKFAVPVAYTNEDLKRLPPVPVVGLTGPIGAPSASAETAESTPRLGPFQLRYWLLSEERLILQAELDWRLEMVKRSHSAISQGPQGGPWPGYHSKNKDSIRSLKMRISVVDARIEALRDDARREGVLLSER